MKRVALRLMRDESGQNPSEYALLAGFISRGERLVEDTRLVLQSAVRR